VSQSFLYFVLSTLYFLLSTQHSTLNTFFYFLLCTLYSVPSTLYRFDYEDAKNAFPHSSDSALKELLSDIVSQDLL
jgi:hypothetical protein